MKHVEVVCAIIVNSNNEVFCCKRGPGALEGFWEFPGGKVEPNETLEETIIREIKEELSSTVKPIKYVGSVYHEYNNIEKPFAITLHGYICDLIKGDLTLSEHTEKKWVKNWYLADYSFAEADVVLLNKAIISGLLKIDNYNE